MATRPRFDPYSPRLRSFMRREARRRRWYARRLTWFGVAILMVIVAVSVNWTALAARMDGTIRDEIRREVEEEIRNRPPSPREAAERAERWGG